MAKKILSLVLAFALCFGGFFVSVPVVASAHGGGGGEKPSERIERLTGVDWSTVDNDFLALGRAYAKLLNSDLESIPTNWLGYLDAVQKVICPSGSDFVYTLVDGQLCEINPDDSIIAAYELKIAADNLKDVLVSENYLYTPKSSGTFKFGYRSEKYLASVEQLPMLRFYNKDYGFCEQGYTDLWFVPYLIKDNGELMLQQYQYRIYIDNWTPQNSDTVTDLNRYCIRVETYSYVDGLEGVLLDSSATIAKSPDLSGLPRYLLLNPLYSSTVPFAFYKSRSLSDYLSGYYDTGVLSYIYAADDGCDYYSSDLTSHIVVGPYSEPWKSTYFNNFCKTYSENPLKTIDVGFLCSGSQIKFKYDFDIDRLPSNTTITINGDSVYDYSITDNSTGDTTTINEYVTNNYAFPENSGNTSGSGGVGSFDGKIEVGGKVEVGGNVDVNVNVNVTGNGNGGGGAVGNPGDYIGDTSGVDMDIADYIELIPKTSKNFIDYMKDFFSWLPPPIFGLIILGFLFLVVRIILKR